MPLGTAFSRAVLAGLVWIGATAAARAELAVPHLEINQDQDTLTLVGAVSGPEGATADTRLSVTRIDASGNSMKSAQGKTVTLRGATPVEVARLVINAGAHPNLVATLQILQNDGVIAETRTEIGSPAKTDTNQSRNDE
ncbi:hypothetical protein BOO69_14340 [Sulfitobacter alexandrii]|uniref:CHRD domain-containing protein n=1 Tax=Sulfitobacter alexandrii TaxID=1917485 RepID=A0A1J0WJI4_9RHOB|nr:hypothetical protein [Sulfitobacter alexandrii]APE44459.1 hypothetical protein BOO69_14340 [Sulfitobacter alexandrii]